ncbi:MAG: LPS assembly lipoprotein LptE [Gallionellaceae bacterium]
MRNYLIIFILLSISLSACGFHVRGHNTSAKNFPFTSLYIKASAITPFVASLKDSLELYKINIADSSATADLTLEIVSESSDKQILALSGTAQVREFQLRYVVSIRAYDKQMVEWLPAGEITLQRSLTYDDALILAKEQEEALLYRDMRADAVQQVLRRLSRAKPRINHTDKTEVLNKPIPAKK